MEQAAENQNAGDRVKRRGRPPKVVIVTPAPDSRLAQAYAERVWAGQSPDVPRKERMERIVRALEAQGMSAEGISL